MHPKQTHPMLRQSYPYYLANQAQQPNTDLVVTDKFTGEGATRVALADPAAIDSAIAASVEAAEAMRKMPTHARQSVLNHCVERFTERADELAMALCIEAGKPINDSRGEVTRLIDTFRIAAEESVRIYGEVMPLDISPRAEGYSGMWKRVPLGPARSSARSISRSTSPPIRSHPPSPPAAHSSSNPPASRRSAPSSSAKSWQRRLSRRARSRSSPAAATAPASSPPTIG